MLQKLIEEQRANGFAGFAGLSLNGKIPFTQKVVNDVIPELVLKGNELITRLEVIIEDQNYVTVNLTVKKWVFSQNFTIRAKIVREVDLPTSPKIKALLPEIYTPVIATIKALGLFPPFITTSGNRVEVDLTAVLRRQNMDDLIRYIKLLEIEGQRGVIFVHFRLEIER